MRFRRRLACATTLGFAALTCFGQAGRLDPTFRPAFNDAIGCILVQQDGKILVAGAFTNVSGQRRERIARLYPDGSVDLNFVAHATWGVWKLGLTPEGKIIALGSFDYINDVPRLYLARLHSGGAVDETFVSDFRQAGSVDFAIQTNGAILITGVEALYRLSPDGIRDDSFRVRLNQGGYLRNVSVLPDGKILIAGNFTSVNGALRRDVARLMTDGSVDPEFDTTTVNLGTDTECLLPQDDGRVVVGGSAFTRLLPNGMQDPSFPYFYTNGGCCREFEMVAQRDGKFIAGGELITRDGIHYGTNLIRYFANGPADSTFNVGTGPNDAFAGVPIHAVAIQPDQRVLVGGYFRDYDGSGQQYLARVLNDWPVLDSRNVGTNEMEVRWPAVYTNFVLQTASSVPSTDWITVTNSPVVISNICVVTNTITSGNQFFRLASP